MHIHDLAVDMRLRYSQIGIEIPGVLAEVRNSPRYEKYKNYCWSLKIQPDPELFIKMLVEEASDIRMIRDSFIWCDEHPLWAIVQESTDIADFFNRMTHAHAQQQIINRTDNKG